MIKKLVKNPSSLSANKSRFEKLYLKVSRHIETAKTAFQRTVDTEMVKAYWLIGRDIVNPHISPST